MGLPDSTTMEVNPIQSENGLNPIQVTLLGISMEVKPVQPLNALFPMLVTLLEISMEVKPVQPEYLQLIVFQFVLLKTVEKWLCGFY